MDVAQPFHMEFVLPHICICLWLCVPFCVSDRDDFASAYSQVDKCQAGAVLIFVSPFYSSPREQGVWLGLSDVDAPGKLRWVNGSDAEEGEEGLPSRSTISRGNVCVSLDQRGQTSSHPCNAKRAYICQYRPQGTLQTLTLTQRHMKNL